MNPVMTRHRFHVLIPGSRTALISPTGDRRIAYADRLTDDPSSGAARIDSLMERVGGRHAAVAIVVASRPARVPGHWTAVVSHMGWPAVVVSRPVAAVSGLGLAAGSARLVIDVRDDGIDVAVVTEDGVIGAEHRGRSTISNVTDAVRSAFTRVDPDFEWAIRQEGVDVLTEGFDPSWTDRLADALEVAVHVTDDPAMLLHAGVQADRAVIERCLPTPAARPSRRPTFHAGGLAGGWNLLRH